MPESVGIEVVHAGKEADLVGPECQERLGECPLEVLRNELWKHTKQGDGTVRARTQHCAAVWMVGTRGVRLEAGTPARGHYCILEERGKEKTAFEQCLGNQIDRV